MFSTTLLSYAAFTPTDLYTMSSSFSTSFIVIGILFYSLISLLDTLFVILLNVIGDL